MEPRIQYATTADGVSIAFWSIGDGLPVVNPPPALPWSHVEAEWQIPEWRHWYEHMSETFRVVRYDNRGSGLSSGTMSGVSLETHVRDLEAVVDRLGLEKFALFGIYYSAPVAIAYAVRHPERVSHLVLWCGITNVDDSQRNDPQQEAFERVRHLDYEMFTELLAHTVFGWSEGEAAHRFAGYMRGALSHEAALECWDASGVIDVTDLLPQITQPTLVMHRRDFPGLSLDVAKRITAGISDSRLKVIEGSSLSPYTGDFGAVLDAVSQFLGVDRAALPRPERPHPHVDAVAAAPAPGGFRTIMFTDMEGSTPLTQRLGDAVAQDLVRIHNTIVADALASFGGSQIKHTGDGIMASFLTASGAVDCAIAIQRELASHNERAPAKAVHVRIGINAGEPVAEGDDLFGTAVQLAARVCARAQSTEVLTTDVVRQLVAGKGFLFADRGEEELRGFEDAVRLFEVRWREDR